MSLAPTKVTVEGVGLSEPCGSRYVPENARSAATEMHGIDSEPAHTGGIPDPKPDHPQATIVSSVMKLMRSSKISGPKNDELRLTDAAVIPGATSPKYWFRNGAVQIKVRSDRAGEVEIGFLRISGGAIVDRQDLQKRINLNPGINNITIYGLGEMRPDLKGKFTITPVGGERCTVVDQEVTLVSSRLPSDTDW